MAVLLCHPRPSGLATQVVQVHPGPCSQLLPPAASLTAAPDTRLVLTHQGAVLQPAAPLQVAPGGLVLVTVLPPPPAPAPPPVAMAPDEVKRFTVALGTALKHPAFPRLVRRLQEQENMGSLAAACPGLAGDPVAQAFLTRPELLLHLLDPDTLAKVGAEHPTILEAAHNLAAAVHEEKGSGGKEEQGGGREEQGGGREEQGGSYYLDEMSDEEIEEAGPSRGQGRPRAQGAFPAITPAQLAQALSAAAGGGGGVTGLGARGGGGVTGLGAAPRGEAAAPPPSRITGDMFQAAMMQAMQASMGGAPPTPAAPQEGTQDFSQQVARMREMGIVDEGLAVRALQIMGGDLQAAVDLIFSGWEGGEDSMQ